MGSWNDGTPSYDPLVSQPRQKIQRKKLRKMAIFSDYPQHLHRVDVKYLAMHNFSTPKQHKTGFATFPTRQFKRILAFLLIPFST